MSEKESESKEEAEPTKKVAPPGQQYVMKKVRVKVRKRKEKPSQAHVSFSDTPRSPGMHRDTSDRDSSSLDPGEIAIKELSDGVCTVWEDAVKLFGTPDDDNIESKKKERSSGSGNTIKSPSKSGRSTEAIMSSYESVLMLKDHNFNTDMYIRSIFGDQSFEKYKIASDDYKRGTQSSMMSRRQQIASNIHNYVKAQQDLLDTKQQFDDKKFPGQKEVEQLCQSITDFRQKMEEFFEPVLKQQKEASDASSLLARVSSYSFIFTLASDIDKMRSAGQFEEIYRLHQKTKQYKFLENVPLFANALKTVHTSYSNVEASLKSKMQNMTMETFNKLYCILYVEIHQPGTHVRHHQLVDVIDDIIDKRIMSQYSQEYANDEELINSLSAACKVNIEALPVCQALSNLLKEIDTLGQKECRDLTDYVTNRLRTHIKNFNLYTEKVFEKMIQMGEKNLPFGQFNNPLHQAIHKIYKMWCSLESLLSRTLFAEVITVKKNIQTKYRTYLNDSIRKILDSDDPGSILIDFLICILDGANIFTPEQYCHIISDPIFGMYDNFHETAIIGNGNIVTSIHSLQMLTESKLTLLIEKYNEMVPIPLPKAINEGLTSVGMQLSKYLEEKLIRSLMQEFDYSINHGIFGSNINWTSKELSIKPDGWPIFIVSRCLECKNTWGNVYAYNVLHIQNLLAAIILSAVTKISEMSDNGIMRITLNISIIKSAFGDRPANIYKKIENKIALTNGGREVASDLMKQMNNELEVMKARIALQTEALRTNKIERTLSTISYHEE